jgi:cytochrome c oxidase subunit 2
VGPIIVVVGLFAASWIKEEDVTELEDDPAVVVDVVGFQWQWRFEYADEDITLIGSRDDGPPELVITPTRTGTFEGRCAEFCGLDHWRMGFTVRVVDRAEYDQWLEERRARG